MSGFTKQAIQASFLKLLDTYPLRDITVRMITEDCGINRKSFYYHDQDIFTSSAPSAMTEHLLRRIHTGVDDL